MIATEKTYRCGCGLWTGERCSWLGPIGDMVVVEHMPESIRASHEAAGNSGSYPHNGSIRVAVERSCAEMVTEDEEEAEWTWVVDAPAIDYATEA